MELPRDHGKSVQVCARLVWELGQQPALRLKLVCATDQLAEERSRFLRDAISGNPLVRLVFPHLKPARPWSANAFTLQRPANVIGPSVAAFGIGAGSTGARADLLVCDDVVDVRSLHSRAERHRVKEYFHNNLMNLLEPDGRCWNLCTPWHGDDLNAQLKQNQVFQLFRRAVGMNFEPVWPEKWPVPKLQERLRDIGPASFARGYRLLPLSEEELLIKPDWVKFWTVALPREAFEFVVISVDPAVSVGKRSDASAVVVLGRRTSSNEVYCLEAIPWHVPMPDLVDRLDETEQRWHADVILLESNAAFAGIRDLLQRQARFGAKLLGITQSRSKSARIAALSVPIRNGAVLLNAGHRELFEELTTYPHAAHDDLADALAMGVEYLLNRPNPRVF